MTHPATGTREIRVFLSSTFRDMQFEREYLIKQIFPEIRKACRARLVEFTEIDLRWGVTREEAEQGKVVRICLEEIDRCRPYFLGFLGERYGWSPSDSDLDNKHELIAQFPVVESSLRAGKSVTEMEILHGVLDNPAMSGHSFFYFRDIALTEALGQKSGALGEYLEADEAGRSKLSHLKARIKASGLPLYENYSSIENLGQRIKRDLLNILDQRYPADEVPGPLQAERMAHAAYAEDRCKAYIANPADIAALNDYVNAGDTQNHPLIISGESGLGKSALLAYWLIQYQNHHPEHFVIQHYVGISGDADAVSLLRRIMAEIKDRYQETDELPGKAEDVVKDFPMWLARVRQNDPLLLVLDGINQLEADGLNWLPSFWPANVRLILSTLPDQKFDELKARGWPDHLVQPMEAARRSQLIQNYLQGYRKALSAAQMDKIASAPQCGNPLFLRTILEELRIFGSFEQLDERIADYLQPTNPAELFDKVLARMEHDYGKDTVASILTAIWAARRGLSETELLGITGISRLDISTFLLVLDYHLGRRGGLLKFFHDYLRQAVRQRYLKDDAVIKAQHVRLANYFDQQPLDGRKAEELPWQWFMLAKLKEQNASQRLADCITDINMHNEIVLRFSEKGEADLLTYWHLLQANGVDPDEAYVKAINETNANLSLLNIFLRHHLAANHAALSASLRQLELDRKGYPVGSPRLTPSLLEAANALESVGRKSEAEPLFRELLSIRRKAVVLTDVAFELPQAIGALARFLSETDQLEEAEALFREGLSLVQRDLPKDHHVSLSLCNDFASLLDKIGRKEEAEELLKHVLEIRRRLGSAPESIGISLNNLAGLLRGSERYEEALPLQREALELFKASLPEWHPNIAIQYENLAVLLNLMRQTDEAESNFRNALAVRRSRFSKYGDDASLDDYLSSINGLGDFLHDMGRLDEVEQLYRDALELRRKNFSPDSMNLVKGLTRLAVVLQDEGKNDEAESLYKEALPIYEKELGGDHRAVNTIRSNLESCIAAQRSAGHKQNPPTKNLPKG